MTDIINADHLLLMAIDTILEHSPDLIFIKDVNLTYVKASKSFANMVGLSSAAQIPGKTDFDFFGPELAARYNEVDRNVIESGDSILDVIEPLPDSNGKKNYSSTSKHAIRDEEGNIIGLYGIGRDITTKLELEEELRKHELLTIKAETDALTGLLNRESTLKYIVEAISACNGHLHALLFIDLDFFKQINDNFGHPFGDQVLRTIAQKLKEIFRNTDIVGRIGGDEFLVLIKDVDSEETVRRKAAEVVSQVAAVRFEGEYCVSITCSVGIALHQGDGTSLAQLYEQADRAMYVAKENGKNQLVFESL